MAPPAPHHILFYDYVEDILQRRAAHRDAHLARIRAEREAARVVMAGALGDPPHGAAIVFQGIDRDAVEAFAEADPYVRAGLVTEWRVERWKVV
ncbi:MAG: YciI family protein [Solirubrobacteraceae bacterium]